MTTIPAGPGWGILGTGSIARTFLGDLHEAGSRVVAVGSRSDETAAAFAAGQGLTPHGSAHALVANPDVDIVYVASPASAHEEHALLAIAAGKHVLVEKPFTLDAEAARRVVEAAEQAGVVVMEAMWTRFLPHMQRVRDLVRDGAIGRVTAIVVDLAQQLTEPPVPRLLDLERGGGALLDLGVYPVSFAWDLLGEPVTVQAHGQLGASGVDAHTGGVLGYADGTHALFHCGIDGRSPNTATVIGESGWIQLDRFWYMPTTIRVHGAGGAVLDEFDGRGPGRGMQFEAMEIEHLVREGSTPTTMPTAQTIGVMATLDEIRRQIGLRFDTTEEI